MTNNATWYLGAMNDGLFIVNRPPSPAGTDVPPGMYPNGPTVFLNVVDLPQEKAQAIVDEHNAAIRALSADRGGAVAALVEVARELARYPTAGAYPDGPCLQHNDHDDLCAALAALDATPPSPAESAAPSGVSDAMVERAMQARIPGGSQAWVWLFNCEGGMAPQDKHRDWFRRVLEAAQPQPGRVEGMDDPLQGHAGTIVGWWREGDFLFALDTDNPSGLMDRGWQPVAVVPPSTAYALPEAPTASSQEPDHG